MDTDMDRGDFEISMESSNFRRKLSVIPWWGDLLTVLGLIYFFYVMLSILRSFSNRWKKMMNARIEKALELRKKSKDPFRGENGYSWDFAMVFKVRRKEDKLTEKQMKPSLSLKALVNKLADAGLQTKLFYSVQNDEVYCKIRAPFKRLMEEAERIEYKLLLDPNQLSGILAIGNSNGPEESHWKPIVIPARSVDTTLDPFAYIYGKFTKAIYNDRGIYKKYSNNSIFRGVDRLKLITSIISARIENGGCQLDTAKLIKDGNIIAFFPLHDFVELRSLEEKWMKICQMPWQQNTSAVKDYYGEKVGLYFVWLGHYTTYLWYASIVGVLAWLFVASDANNPNSPVMPYFAVFIAIWSSLFLEYWKRKENDTSMKWGMVGYEQTAEARSEFQGIYKPNPVTGEPYLYFPRNEYAKRVAQSTVIIIALIAVVIALVAGIFYFRIVESLSGDLLIDNIQFAGIVASLLNSIQISIMNYIYSIVSVKVNEWENHRTEIEFEDALIAKTFIFQFVNSFVSLFYVAFVKPFIQAFDSCHISCMDELQTGLSTIFLTRLATGNFLKILMPSIDKYMREKAETEGIDDDRELSEIEKLFMLTPYDATTDIFGDYAEMMMQFGYATMFIVAYPLATVMSFVNNFVEMRVMAWKLCQLCRRPLPKSTEDIGTWADILEIMTYSAVITNAALVAFTGDMTYDYQWPTRIWIFFGFTLGVVACKLGVAILIPDVSREVEIQLERQQVITDKVIENMGDENEDNLNQKVDIKIRHMIRITDTDPY